MNSKKWSNLKIKYINPPQKSLDILSFIIEIQYINIELHFLKWNLTTLFFHSNKKSFNESTTFPRHKKKSNLSSHTYISLNQRDPLLEKKKTSLFANKGWFRHDRQKNICIERQRTARFAS